MSPLRLVVLACSCLSLVAAPLAAQTSSTSPRPAATSRAARPAKARPAAKGSTKPASAAATTKATKKGADCDVPEAQAKVAAKAPIPVAADPLAPAVAPCPPGQSGAAAKP